MFHSTDNGPQASYLKLKINPVQSYQSCRFNPIHTYLSTFPFSTGNIEHATYKA